MRIICLLFDKAVRQVHSCLFIDLKIIIFGLENKIRENFPDFVAEWMIRAERRCFAYISYRYAG